MAAGYTVQSGTIVLNRELTALDIFVRDFLDVLKKHSDYLVVSGYVSIATGRSRGTEDVDILMPQMSGQHFAGLFKALDDAGYWCYQGDSAPELLPYHKDMLPLRFARKDQMFPNLELIPINIALQFFEFNHPQKIRIDGFEFNAPPIEFEILYKELILGTEKDLEDARHLRAFFADCISDEKLDKFARLIKENG